MREWLNSIWLKIEQLKCSQSVMVKAMIWCGTRLFRCVVLWRPPEKKGELRAIHFATSEADFNSSARNIVEMLDESYKEKHGEVIDV